MGKNICIYIYIIQDDNMMNFLFRKNPQRARKRAIEEIQQYYKKYIKWKSDNVFTLPIYINEKRITFLIQVTQPENFPNVPPIVHLQSGKHPWANTNGELCYYPYINTWDNTQSSSSIRYISHLMTCQQKNPPEFNEISKSINEIDSIPKEDIIKKEETNNKEIIFLNKELKNVYYKYEKDIIIYSNYLFDKQYTKKEINFINTMKESPPILLDDIKNCDKEKLIEYCSTLDNVKNKVLHDENILYQKELCNKLYSTISIEAKNTIKNKQEYQQQYRNIYIQYNKYQNNQKIINENITKYNNILQTTTNNYIQKQFIKQIELVEKQKNELMERAQTQNFLSAMSPISLKSHREHVLSQELPANTIAEQCSSQYSNVDVATFQIQAYIRDYLNLRRKYHTSLAHYDFLRQNN